MRPMAYQWHLSVSTCEADSKRQMNRMKRLAGGMLDHVAATLSLQPNLSLLPSHPPPFPPLPPATTSGPGTMCLTWLQKEEWTAADGTFKLHKSKLELAKEEAAAARSHTLSALLVQLYSILIALLVHLDSIMKLWPGEPAVPSPTTSQIAANCVCSQHCRVA